MEQESKSVGALLTSNQSLNPSWQGGSKPLNASYGKMMMWFFIVSDALTFSGFLTAYSFSRYKHLDSWPIADEVFTHFPFLHGAEKPMYYVALMTFILISSSFTMVLAVDAGHQLKKAKTTLYMLLTIIGGLIFLGSQAWEWKNFIKGEYGALEARNGGVLQFVWASTGKRAALKEFALSEELTRAQHQSNEGIWYLQEKKLPAFTVAAVKNGFQMNTDVLVRIQEVDETGKKIILNRAQSIKAVNEAVAVIEGANLIKNEYGNPLFANYFFFITGFHGFHVFSGVFINFIIFFNIILGTYEKRKHYEMIEKVGLYWHFVDLVWVFVFTFFYLV